MRNSFENKLITLKCALSGSLRKNKCLYILLFSVFIVGFLIGAFFKTPVSVRIYYIEYAELYYFRIFSASSGMFSIFFSRIFNNLLYFTVIFVFSLWAVLIPLNFFIIFYRGFVLGTVCVIIFKTFGINGIVLSVLVIAPQNIITTFFMVVFIVSGIERARSRSVLCRFEVAALFKEGAVLFALAVLGALYELIFTALILRPINFLF